MIPTNQTSYIRPGPNQVYFKPSIPLNQIPLNPTYKRPLNIHTPNPSFQQSPIYYYPIRPVIQTPHGYVSHPPQMGPLVQNPNGYIRPSHVPRSYSGTFGMIQQPIRGPTLIYPSQNARSTLNFYGVPGTPKNIVPMGQKPGCFFFNTTNIVRNPIYYYSKQCIIEQKMEDPEENPPILSESKIITQENLDLDEENNCDNVEMTAQNEVEINATKYEEIQSPSINLKEKPAQDEATIEKAPSEVQNVVVLPTQPETNGSSVDLKNLLQKPTKDETTDQKPVSEVRKNEISPEIKPSQISTESPNSILKKKSRLMTDPSKLRSIIKKSVMNAMPLTNLIVSPKTSLLSDDPTEQMNYMTVYHSKSIQQLESLNEEGKERTSPRKISAIDISKLQTNHSHHEAKPSKILEHPDLPLLQDIPLAKEFVKIYDSLKESGKNFIDPDFPPNHTSLYEKIDSCKEDIWKDYVWMRPKEFFPDGYKVFSFEASNMEKALFSHLLKKSTTLAAIDMEDIVQGALGDCYFLSSLAALARKPSRIRSLFMTTKTDDAGGIYCLRICHEGNWQAVYVDDYFPCKADRSGPVFSQSKAGENELWVLLLEKAWAKLFHTYERIEAGLTRDVLGDLTGAPTRIVWNDDPELWDLIVDAVKNDYLLTAGAADEDQMDKYFQTQGMVVGHAYTLLGCYEVLGEKLVKVRNPWGKGEWEGPWGDKDPIWNKLSLAEKAEIGYLDKDDGSFFMSFELFKHIYSDTQICMVHDDYIYTSCEIRSKKKKAVYLEIEVEEEGQYYFTVLQRSFRKMWDTHGYDYSRGTIVLAKKNNDNFEFIQAKTQYHREAFLALELKKGTYVCSCKVDWCWTDESTFVLTSYGVNSINIKMIPNPKEFLEKVYISKAMSSKKKSKLNDLKVEKCVEVFPKEGYGYYYLENEEEKTVNVVVNLENTEEEIRIKKKFRDGKNFKVNVGPKEKKIVMFRVKNDKELKPKYEENVTLV